ncbi:unnamed protein product [Rhizophagus irregularis]|uniref:AIG1-type G domain-containing protein n=1 Tax=Rhizophagus irregularis TaxID=588596 RepID=A0A2I1H7S7_9GLOM|nr:hypothetical protein RhiirA4_548471 [Rhizophagus irregularis]CAB4444940.1 unnamed protein product [Rhizophagus irregularis]CAB4445034.1 unnamed protein product [Rhizophagus irregularis]
MNNSQVKRIKNLLIIGHTNVGKSTLCNVLCDTNDFEENDYTTKKTRNFQEKVFVFKETKYRIVEVGVDSVEKKDLYNKIGEIVYSMPEGISQVLFLVDGRFTEEEIRTFEAFEKEILNSGIVDYTTIVRTKFENFKIKEKYEDDKSQMCRGSGAIFKMVKSCRYVIYVDNPPINITIEDDDDRERVENNRKIRTRSRKILLDHLETAYEEKYYKLKLEVPEFIPDDQVTQEMKKAKKNILIVGRTGSGISALCNVLTDTEEFKESGCSISMTDNFQKKDFEWCGKKYCVVDTVGIDNTRLSTNEVLHKIAEGICSMPEGLSQVLFVVDGNFTAGETRIFNLLKDSIFSMNILGYVTIVRTKFSNFKNSDKCDINRNQLRNENEKIAEIVRSCRDVVHIDNPPTNIEIVDKEDERTVKTNKGIRKRSREILLNYLDKACKEEYFKLKPWNELRKQIDEYLESH